MTEASAARTTPIHGTSFRAVFGCDLAEVRAGLALVGRFLQGERLTVQELKECDLALTEACNNAVQYASLSGRGQPVEVEAVCDATTVTLRVYDHTPGFNWRGRASLPAAEAEHGRGLFIIGSVMDMVDYQQGREGNCLWMRKQRSHAAESAPRSGADATERLQRRLADAEAALGGMSEELASCYESLAAIFNCSGAQPKSGDLEQYSRTLLDELSRITMADWYVLRLVSEDEEKLVLFVASHAELELEPIALGVADAASVISLEALAVARRRTSWYDQANPFGAARLPPALSPSSTGIIVPFSFGVTLVGTLVLGKNHPASQFTAAQTNVAHTLAKFLGIQVVNARLREEHVANLLVARELDIARNIQRSLFPQELPQVGGFSLAGYWQSAARVGGDYCDAFSPGEGQVLMLVADVMGKGVAAAIFVAILRGLVHGTPHLAERPGELLGHLNRLLYRNLSDVDMFITAQVVFLDTVACQITAACAGHGPGLLASSETASPVALFPEGVPLGVIQGAKFEEQRQKLGSCCRLLVFTDGVTEAQNPQGERFGQKRLAHWLQESTGLALSAEGLKDALVAELDGFRQERPLLDDQSFLVLAAPPGA